MGSGSGSGRSRHRQADTGSTESTDGTTVTGRHRRPEIGPGTPPVDPLCDTGSTGLRMFNLGSIPASVTPPRSWRRAAWFTVIASAAALTGLLTIGALLVGPSHHTGRITALPYFPDGKPLASLGAPTSSGVPTRPGPVTPDSEPPTRATTGDTTSHIWAGRPVTLGGRSTTHRPAPPVTGTPPVVTTVTGAGDPMVDPAKLIKRTRTFFAEVTSNAQAAADLTTGTVHDDAVALIRGRYGDLAAIQVQRISLDPDTGLAVCLVRATGKDGSIRTRQVILRFTPGGDPKISNPGG